MIEWLIKLHISHFSTMDPVQASPAPTKNFYETREHGVSQLSVDGRPTPSFHRVDKPYLKRLQATRRRVAYEKTDEFKNKSASAKKGVATKKRKEIQERISFLETRHAYLLAQRDEKTERIKQALHITDVSRFSDIIELNRLLDDTHQRLTLARKELAKFNSAHPVA